MGIISTIFIKLDLNKIMKESAVIALEYIKSNYKDLGINKEID